LLEAIHDLNALRLYDLAAAQELDQRLTDHNVGTFDTEEYRGADAVATLFRY
jgi:hypothetical protein